MKPTILLFLALLLTACTAVTPSPAPTVTPPPSATSVPSATPAPTATATPTLVPTPTPTPIPTLPPEQVGGLEGVPDPRVAAPGLFDLAKSDAPIPQFVKAMEMGGIKVDPQEVVDNLQYRTITGVDGKQYVIGTYNLDPDPNKSGETLEGKIPLVIWSEEGGWKPITNSLRDVLESRNFLFGSQIVYYKLNDRTYVELAKGNFNFFTSSGEIKEASLWLSGPNEPYRFNYSRINSLLNFAKANNVTSFHIKNLVEPAVIPTYGLWPNWAVGLSGTELERVIRERIVDTMSNIRRNYPDEIIISVLSEAFDWDRFTGFVYEKLGRNYIFMAYRTAREADPNAILLYEDVNLFHEGRIDDHDRAAISLVQSLQQQGLIDGVGMEMHLNANRIPSPETFRQLIRAYKKTGVERIYITEFDIDFSQFRGTETEKQVLKARVYGEMLRVALEENVNGFAMFGFTGAAAWHPDGLLFNEYYQPEPAFYAVASELVK